MPLSLVLGPANSAKAGEVLGAYAAAARRGAILVVPTAADARHYTRELAADGAVLGSIVTFAGLAAEIARRAGYGGSRLSSLQRRRVLRRAVRATRLDVLGRAARSAGFVAAAGELISELERTLVTPQRFAAAMRAWAAEDSRREPYARDVASIYSAYARELEALGRVDGELFAWRALDALRGAPVRWGSDAVFFYGFDDLQALQRDAVETLARIVGVPVTVSLTYEAGRSALRARAEVVEELRPLAERVIELPALDEHYEPGARAALSHLERWLFETPPVRIDPAGAVRLLEAGGERAEAELIAAEVLALLRAGVPGEEIAVVHRVPARAALVLEAVFDQYGIPIAIERELPFGHVAIGRALLSFCRVALVEGGPEDLLAYLRYPGVLERADIADALEAQVLQRGVRDLAPTGGLISDAAIDALVTARDPAAELVRQARRLFAAPHRRGAPVVGRDEELDARALAALLRTLEEVRDLGERPEGPELIELLEELRVPAGARPRPGAVLVSDPLAIRARRFRAVLVCGLVEGAFPLAPAPEPFLSDERRRELAACSGVRLAPTEDALARERYLFYACVSRATEHLVLSYHSSDEEGNLALPSPFLADVGELFVEGWPDRRRRRLLADVVWPPEEAPTARELDRSLAAAAAPAGGEVPSPIRSLSEVALRHVRHREIVSGGALETYADCPVKWLVERELQPAALEPDSDALVRGSYMHLALEDVLQRLGRSVTAKSLPEAFSILEEVLGEMGRSFDVAPGRPEGVRAAALRMIEADLRRYLRFEAGDGLDWQPAGVEVRFGFAGEEGSLPPLELGERSGEVSVRGAIDRVDVDPEGTRAIVRDYKSGPARPEHQGARWEPDRRLQVALYMLAVRQLLGVEPVAGFYQPLGGSDLRPRGVFLDRAPVGSAVVANDARSRDELDVVLEDARARALAATARLRSGELVPCPETCSRDGCRHPGICRSQ